MARIRVGISGWSYAGWRGDFYPKGLVHRRELAYAAERMPSIELNGSFYSLQRPSSYQTWREQTPEDFVFAVKGGRFITHLKKLAGVETALANFFASGVLALGPKLGPFLWQLPANLGFDAERLTAFFDLLRRHDIACVVADTAGRFPLVEQVTSDFMYVRLHGEQELYVSGYSDASLDRWAERCLAWQASGQDVYVYFDNDAKGYAPHDALSLQEKVCGSAQRPGELRGAG